MIKLQEARITDAVPASLAAQPWVQALGYAEWKLRCLILEYARQSQIYTALDTCPETVLDALAVSWKVDWYDTTYPVEKKRSIIRNSMAVRRYMGTAWSTRRALNDVWADSSIEEWFQYGGTPGCFRVICNITDPSVTADLETIRGNVLLYKRESAHLESINFMVQRGIQIGAAAKAYKVKAQRCGTLKCGTYPHPTTLGVVPGDTVRLAADVEVHGGKALRCGPPICGAAR